MCAHQRTAAAAERGEHTRESNERAALALRPQRAAVAVREPATVSELESEAPEPRVDVPRALGPEPVGFLSFVPFSVERVAFCTSHLLCQPCLHGINWFEQALRIEGEEGTHADWEPSSLAAGAEQVRGLFDTE